MPFDRLRANDKSQSPQKSVRAPPVENARTDN
jgi:hypothetical protein